jgi:phage protein D
MSDSNPPPNIPNPDPSLATNERLENARLEIRREMVAKFEESKGWIERLQELLEEKIKAAAAATDNLDRVVQTRLAGSETALNAAMAAADKVTQKIENNSGALLTELKAGMSKQIDALNEKIDGLKERMAESGGSRSGSGHTISMVIAAMAALAAVVSVAIVLMNK